MRLSATTITPYLLDRGWLNATAILDGSVTIHEENRRNRNLVVLVGNTGGLFVKQPASDDAYAHETVQREAEFYKLCREHRELTIIRRSMPAFKGFDPFMTSLSLDLIKGENLRASVEKTGTVEQEVASAIGRALARLHAVEWKKIDRSPALFPCRIPWVFDLVDHDLPGMNQINRDAFSYVRQNARFVNEVRTLRSEWTQSAIIHGDIKFDNCIIVPEAPQSIVFVDWEMVDTGDPAWDVGSVLQAFLSTWILSNEPTSSGLKPGDGIVPLSEMTLAIRAFWDGYTAGLPMPPDSDTLLLKSIRYSAVRLLQTTFESLQSFGTQPRARTMIHIAYEILINPQSARERLYGIE